MSTCTVGIIAAMEEEVQHLREQITDLTITNEGTIELYSGTINNVNVVVIRSGIGKVNAAIAATLLIRDFHPTCIINTGSAGGIKSSMNVGDIVISTAVFHHDFDLKPLGFKHGEIPGLPVLFEADEKLMNTVQGTLAQMEDQPFECGHIGTGEFFVSQEKYVAETLNRFPDAIAIEMEGAAIAQVCHQFEVPFVVLRAISDVADKESPMSFEQFVEVAGIKSAQLMIQTLPELEKVFG